MSSCAWDLASENQRSNARVGEGFSTREALRHFIERVPPLAPDAFRIERLLAIARIFLSVAAVLVYFLTARRTEATPLLLLVAYAGYSAVIWSALRLGSSSPGRLPISLHLLDLVWVGAITTATGGAASPLFGLFLFILLEAAYRWGFQATVVTMAAILFFLFPQAAVLNASGSRAVAAVPSAREEAFSVPIDLMTTRAVYLAIGGLLIGYIAGREKQHRDESAIIARLTAMVRAELGMMGSLKALFPALRQLFNARAILLVAQEPRNGSLFLWQQDDSADMRVSFGELVPSEHDVYLFPMPGEAWHALSGACGLRPAVEVFSLESLESDGRLVQNSSSPIAEAFAARHPFNSLFGVSLSFGGDWDDRLFLLDPAADGRQLPFLLRLMRQLGPALKSVYVQGRSSSRIGEMERARLARELHDSTVQSLIGLEMELAAWRRNIGDGPSPLSDPLCGFQQRLREEIVNLRELTQQLRPVHVEAPKLLSYLSDLVDRFQRETGIPAYFVSNVDRVDMSHEVCCGLIRILQEALVNVRKHSGAHNVLVTFTNDQDRWVLVVDDDGCGFDFVGCRAHAERDSDLKGPAVIKERVRLLGGELKLDSDPKRGARLEVTLPGAICA